MVKPKVLVQAPSDTATDDMIGFNLIGVSRAFTEVMRLVRRIAANDAAVLIQGETGTGKELVARAIHYLSARREYPFLPVNCGAMPDALAENELFGHERGAFTGASGEHPGLLRLAHGGTLFLDEVDSLPLKAQATLLRFLQDHRFRPLGARREEEADVRVVAASNCNLMRLIKDGLFRSDLYYRLKLISLELPPLRVRVEDIKLLAEHFIQACAQRYGTPCKRLHPDTLSWMPQYQWPGNVRELENMLHGEFLLSDEPELRIARPDVQPDVGIDSDAEVDVSDRIASYSQAKARALSIFNHAYLERLLAATSGNISSAAKIAGKERRALGKLIKRYHISLDDLKAPRPQP